MDGLYIYLGIHRPSDTLVIAIFYVVEFYLIIYQILPDNSSDGKFFLIIYQMDGFHPDLQSNLLRCLLLSDNLSDGKFYLIIYQMTNFI